MSDLDIIPIPGHPGMYGRRVLVEAWQAAGSPPINPKGAGRLYDDQKDLWDGWADRLPGFAPADNPDDESQPLAHVRFVALDIDPTPERVERLAAAGLVRPYRYEGWHWQLPGDVRRFAIVRNIPTIGGTTAPTVSEEDDMKEIYIWWIDAAGQQQNLIYAPTGYGEPWTGNGGAYNTEVANAHNLAGPPAKVSEGHAINVLNALSNMRTGQK